MDFTTGWSSRLWVASAAVLALLQCGSLAPVHAQLPSGTIKIICSGPTGGGTDQVTRLLALRLQTQLKQTVIVETHAGASGAIAAGLVSRAKPDGGSLLVTFDAHVINAAASKGPTYQPVKDFAPITQLASSGVLITMKPDAPVNSLKDFIAWGKGFKGNLNFGVPGEGSPAAVAARTFVSMTGVDAAVVNNKGSSPTLTGVMAGEYHAGFASLQASLPMVGNKLLKAIAVSTPKRISSHPDIPSVSEELPGFEFTTWYGLLGPAKLPQATISRLHDEAVTALKAPEVRDVILRDGSEPIGSSPSEFAEFLEREHAKWTKLLGSK